MNIYSSLDNIAFEKPTAVTIGNFDGVHLGHKELINRTIAIGEEKDILPVMFTFSNHPLEFLYKKQIDYLTSFEQKVKMIIVVNYRRYKRKKRIEQMRKNREFKLVDGGRKGAERGSFHVA